MFRRSIAAAFVVIWLSLLAIEFFEDSGLLHYHDADVDEAVVTALKGLGEAIGLSDDTIVTKYRTGNLVDAVYPFLSRVDGPVPPRRWRAFPKKIFPIYKVDQIFLI
ncbi:MAG: hypothetical protein HY695_29465 [Deltaproteobacteria bacterium]|nr:hypothetical protein [Deltaproteobacteria bacterium]